MSVLLEEPGEARGGGWEGGSGRSFDKTSRGHTVGLFVLPGEKKNVGIVREQCH